MQSLIIYRVLSPCGPGHEYTASLPEAGEVEKNVSG